MKKIIRNTLAITLIIFGGNVFADKGVFSPQVSPDEVISNEESIITFTAEVGAENLYISSVAVYETTAEGKPISRIGVMHDDGLNGDERAADTIFSYQLPMTNTAEGERYFVISAAYSINTYEPFSEERSAAQNDTLNSIGSNFEADVQIMTLEEARQAALQQALQAPNVESAVIEGRYLNIVFKDGTQGVIDVSDPSEVIDGLGNSIP